MTKSNRNSELVEVLRENENQTVRVRDADGREFEAFLDWVGIAEKSEDGFDDGSVSANLDVTGKEFEKIPGVVSPNIRVSEIDREWGEMTIFYPLEVEGSDEVTSEVKEIEVVN